MSDQPVVSIVTASYRHAPYLRDYFESILAQTYSRIQLVFIDDGSPDDTWAIANSYRARLEEKLHSVTMLRQENQGAFKTFARAIALATGEFLCLFESDDYYLPHKIEKNVEFFRDKPDYVLVHSDTHHLFEDGLVEDYRRTCTRQTVPVGNVYEHLLAGNFVATISMCARTSVVHQYVSFLEFEARGYRMGDYPMHLELARHGKFGYLPESTAVYRVLPQSFSRSPDGTRDRMFWRSGYLIQLDYLLEDGRKAGEMSQSRRRLYAAAAFNLFALGFRRDSLAYQWTLVRQLPFSWFSVKMFAKSLVRLLTVPFRRKSPGGNMSEIVKSRASAMSSRDPLDPC